MCPIPPPSPWSPRARRLHNVWFWLVSNNPQSVRLCHTINQIVKPIYVQSYIHKWEICGQNTANHAAAGFTFGGEGVRWDALENLADYFTQSSEAHDFRVELLHTLSHMRRGAAGPASSPHKPPTNMLNWTSSVAPETMIVQDARSLWAAARSSLLMSSMHLVRIKSVKWSPKPIKAIWCGFTRTGLDALDMVNSLLRWAGQFAVHI